MRSGLEICRSRLGPSSRKGRKSVVELCGGADFYGQQDRLRRLHGIARRRDLRRMQRIAGWCA